MSSIEVERTVWSYKKIEDNELSNKNLEIILNFYDKTKFELNINKFSSSFNIDLESFLDNSNENNKKNELSDDIFSSSYHHSLILGSFELNEDNSITLTIEKVFTNEEDKFSESNKVFNIKYDNEKNAFIIDKNSVLSSFADHKEKISLTPIKTMKK